MNASHLLSHGWTRHFLGRSKWGNEQYAWRHPEHPEDHSYQEAVSKIIRERKHRAT